MEQLGGINISNTNPTFLTEELAKLRTRIDKSDEFLEGRERIEQEADFVDEVILKVGSRKVYSTVYQDRVRIQSEILKKYQKNPETSRHMRDHGNILFYCRNFQDALHYYNLALMFAQTDTEAAGLAYANRAAVLLELGRFEDALQDVESALLNKYPPSRVKKLQQRKLRCRSSLKKKQEEYVAIDPKLRKEIESEILEMKNIRDEMLKVKRPNPVIPAAAEFVEIKFDAGQGRRLIVNQDVVPGTVLIVEEPIMFTLYGQAKWDTDHCHHCLKHIWRGIPCGNCVFAIYCSERCRVDAQIIHYYECSCVPSFHAMHAVDQLLLAVRTILKVGPKELFRLFQTRDPTYFHTKQQFGTEPHCVYNSNSYQTVFHLTTHSDKLHPMKLAINVQHALIATSVLDNETNFFEDVAAESKTEFKNFVAGLILHHIEASAINAASVVEVDGLENASYVDSSSGKIPAQKLAKIMEWVKFRKLAPALYPLFSLINHSCDPNVYYMNHTTSGTMLVVGHRELKKGEPLLIAYTHNFSTGEISTRQTYLEQRHHFKCQSIACEMKWPTLFTIPDPEPKFCCPACSKMFFEYEKGSDEFRKCLLAGPKWECGRCGKSYTSAELMQWLNVSKELSIQILRLFELNRARKAFELFPRLLSYLQYHTFPPNGHLYVTQNLYMRTLAVVLFYAQE